VCAGCVSKPRIVRFERLLRIDFSISSMESVSPPGSNPTLSATYRTVRGTALLPLPPWKKGLAPMSRVGEGVASLNSARLSKFINLLRQVLKLENAGRLSVGIAL